MFVNYALALLLVGFLIYLSFYELTTVRGWHKVGDFWRVFLQGWEATVLLSLATMLCSGALGVLLLLCRKSGVLILRDLSRIYTEVIRGTPLLAQIFILNYGIFHQAGFDNRYVNGALILSGFSGAYFGEIIRAGIESIGKSQIDSARAIGLTARANLPLCDRAAGDPPHPAAAGGIVRRHHQKLLAPLRNRRE